ncbi:1,6-dihydroxycyclohexa-2,4-diene-1-carboxylate dehydrogenase [Rhodococcus sp. BP-252]|uniref:benzoate 1,2-dioxygenase electron transfer component BenC n=1 Tax=unclassified Rhodococcus (in: high G+C Gram-positive bacteria) TaxID=192944 RepID=UPI001C9A9E1F|nr:MULTISPECIES: benzoate 1,2-dioxygenase electron transfer component BenC [unclassified Rhodococcus (in: high G+C Gram-positive bacteria)]MBY6412809.1 1,6-dihydroxycyclohexa-2,4-diene-1-carboxylate dehydrogenase [Rhodococcus sp. BP-320]MBY6417654.1 1,6-dihydroxycyclohexa-2,4-diene-1-carboxylate dehydrogenase [Rhodococcus sp. BP-321]MBY6423506.1 1,6-dihydroxycyclohexa-2,4-diene-1-carboxylate dehydrogenase [Rhodococcus sp. BP-324]MBY6427678.1 1,6-dihydroxycyclohexa-2,4-diene-1-carboxylate dehydr
MSHRVALSFEDGVTRFITCADGQTVADAAYRSRINIPLDCRDGACGTCKALCESGDYNGGVYLEDALSDSESEQGYCLPCSMTPKSDLVLQIASTSAVAKTQASTYLTTITAVDRLSPTTVRLVVRSPESVDLAFLPGQYVNISVPGGEETRSYSFSNTPGAEELEFLVKLTPGGLMSTFLDERAEVGNDISFTGPHGSFFLREADRPALLLAGGTGLAPILSILRKLNDENSSRPVHLVYGASTDDDVVLLDELEQLAKSLENLTWDYCVADPNSTAEHKGYVTGLIEPKHLYDGDVAVYLCGPPPMVEAVRSYFTNEGVEPTGFYYEKFAPSSKPTEGEPSSAPETEVVAEEPDAAVPAPTEKKTDRSERPASESSADENIEGDATRRTVCGQTVFEAREYRAPDVVAPVSPDEELVTLRAIAGQRVGKPGSTGPLSPLDDDDAILRAGDARSVAGQTIWPERDIEPHVTREDMAASDSYEIGEEHPSVHESDAVFEARRALELGALELVIGRLSSQQLAGYRLLAETTTRYVDGDQFVDAAAYTETNAAFHDYLFTQTGNEHLLQAYQALGVKAAMAETLRNATWCEPSCAQDHVDIVDAFDAQDRDRARTLIAEHAERSKVTMRRAMQDIEKSKKPAFVHPGRFAGKVVLVTGAAQGIGEWVARRISAEGGDLVLADRSELVESLAEELHHDEAHVTAVLADLETWEGASSVVEAAIARHGRVDVSIHVVGGTIWAKPLAEYPPDQIEKEISRSLFPTLWSCRAVVPHMIERRQGTIVNVSSVATRGINRVPYGAAKGGVNAITANLAQEVAPYGIRVAATAPGGTDAPPRRIARGPGLSSDQERSWYQELVDQTVGSSLLGRYGTLDEQAAAICFLASDEASYITGTVLPVAGGDLG